MTESTEAQADPEETVKAPPEIVPSTVHIYVCPGCGSWYGSGTTPDLAKTPNIRSSMRNTHERPEEVRSITGYRIECQLCKAQGITVNRLHLAYVRMDVVERVLGEQVEELYLEEERRSGAKLRHST